MDVMSLREELERYSGVAERFFGPMWNPENPPLEDLRPPQVDCEVQGPPQ